MRIPESMSEAARLLTAEELEKLPGDDRRCELVQGRLVRMSPVGFQHGHVVVQLAGLLNSHVRSRRLGAVLTEVGFTLASNPDTVRAPDIAFLRADRLPPARPRGFWKGEPDLAIEVLSPDDRPMEIEEKILDYLTRGVPLVVIVDADTTTVSLHRPSVRPSTLGPDEILDLGDVVAGFRCPVAEIFE